MIAVKQFDELETGMPIAIDCFVCGVFHNGILGGRADHETDGPAFYFIAETPCNREGALVSEKRTILQSRVYRR